MRKTVDAEPVGRRRARNIVLGIAVVLSLAPPLAGFVTLALDTAFGATTDARVISLSQAVGQIVLTIPLTVFLVVAIIRIDIVSRAFWFLPLYFVARSASSLVTGAGWLFWPGTPLGELSPLSSRAGVGLTTAAVVAAINGGLAAALWVLRPRFNARVEDDVPT